MQVALFRFTLSIAFNQLLSPIASLTAAFSTSGRCYISSVLVIRSVNPMINKILAPHFHVFNFQFLKVTIQTKPINLFYIRIVTILIKEIYNCPTI